jgi:hypothetical protein
MFHLISSFKKRLTIVVWGMIMAFSAASQVELSCGEIVVKNPPNKGEFFDRFGNLYSAADLKAFNYPNDVILEDCESGLFTLQFGLMGNAGLDNGGNDDCVFNLQLRIRIAFFWKQ